MNNNNNSTNTYRQKIHLFVWLTRRVCCLMMLLDGFPSYAELDCDTGFKQILRWISEWAFWRARERIRIRIRIRIIRNVVGNDVLTLFSTSPPVRLNQTCCCLPKGRWRSRDTLNCTDPMSIFFFRFKREEVFLFQTLTWTISLLLDWCCWWEAVSFSFSFSFSFSLVSFSFSFASFSFVSLVGFSLSLESLSFSFEDLVLLLLLFLLRVELSYRKSGLRRWMKRRTNKWLLTNNL